jgi:hypothetical protein
MTDWERFGIIAALFASWRGALDLVFAAVILAVTLYMLVRSLSVLF